MQVLGSGVEWTLDQCEESEPAVGMIWFDLVVTWREADAIKCPFFDVFVARDFVPAFEFFLAVLRFPVAPVRVVLVDSDVTTVGWTIGFSKDVRDVWLELLGLVFF